MKKEKKILPMKEKNVEKYLKSQCKLAGILSEKFVSPGKRHVPDQILSFSPGLSAFVECKATGQSPTLMQAKDHEARRKLGFYVGVVDSRASVDQCIADVLAYRENIISMATDSVTYQAAMKKIRDKAAGKEIITPEDKKLIVAPGYSDVAQIPDPKR